MPEGISSSPEVPRPAPTTPEAPVAAGRGSEPQVSSIDRSLRSPQAVVESLEAARAAGARIPKVLNRAVLSEQPSTYIKPGEFVGYAGGAPNLDELEYLKVRRNLSKDQLKTILQTKPDSLTDTKQREFVVRVQREEYEKAGAEGAVERQLKELIDRREYRIAGAAGLPYEQARDINCPELLPRMDAREELPKIELVVAGMERYYGLSPEDQITPREMAIHNSFREDFLEYTVLQETDPRLAGIRKNIEALGEKFGVTKFTRVDADGKTVTVSEHDIQSRVEIISAAIDAEPSLKKYNDVRNQLNLLKREILDIQLLANGDQESEQDRADRLRAMPKAQRDRLDEIDASLVKDPTYQRTGDVKDALVALREILEGFDKNDPKLARIDTVVSQHEQHPMFKLIELHEKAHEVYKEIKDKVEPSKTKEVIKKPDGSFKDVLATWDAAPDDSSEKEAARKEIEAYLSLAREIGLLSRTDNDLDSDLLTYMAKQKGENNEKITPVSKIIDDLETEDIALSHADPQVRAQARLEFEGRETKYINRFNKDRKTIYGPNIDVDVVKVNGQDVNLDQFDGIMAYNLRQGRLSIYEHFRRLDAQMPGLDLGVTKEAWNVKEAQERLVPQRERRLWEISGAGYYQVFAQSFDEVREVTRSMSRYVRGTALRKDAQSLLGELQYLGKAITGTEGYIPLDVPANFKKMPEGEGKNKIRKDAEDKRARDLADLSREFYIENLAYLCELFTRNYNGEYLSAIYAKMNDISEAFYNWESSVKLHDGQVLLASMIDEEPDSELRYRMQGRNLQFYRHTGAMIVLHKGERESLAQKMVGRLINDRYVSRDGIYYEGSTAISQNRFTLGVDQPNAVGAVINPDPELIIIRLKQIAKEPLSDKDQARLDMHALKTKLANSRYVGSTADLLRLQALGKALGIKPEKVLTENEQKALTLRQIKLRIAEGTIKPRDIPIGYKIALAEAREAVQVYMQFNSMTGEKTERGCPGLLCAPRDKDGNTVYSSLEAKTADEIPLTTEESLVMFALNMADIQIDKHNKKIIEAIERAKKAPNKKAKLAGDNTEYEIKKLVGMMFMRNERDENNDPTGKYKDLLAQVRDDAIRATFKYGWRVGLTTKPGEEDSYLYQLDLNNPTQEAYSDETLEEKTRYKFDIAKVNGIKIKVTDPHNKDASGIAKPVTLFSAAKSVFGRHLETTYIANQREIQDQICSERIYLDALDLREGRKTMDQVDILAVQRLIVDPTLERIPTYCEAPFFAYRNEAGELVRIKAPNDRPNNTELLSYQTGDLIAGPDGGSAQQNGLEIYIGAACEESYLRFMLDARQRISSVFDELTEYGIPNFDGATKRLYYPQALAASNASRWSPRGRWMVSRLYTGANSLKTVFGLKKFFDSVKLIFRKDKEQEKVDQEVIDPPIYQAQAMAMGIQVQQNGTYFGTSAEGKSNPGYLEKPFAELEKLVNEKTQLSLTILDPNRQHKFRDIETQQTFWRVFEPCMARAKEMMDPGLSNLSRNATGEGLWDLSNEDFFIWEDETGIMRQGWSFYQVDDEIDDYDVRDSRTNVGRARHLSRPLARSIIAWMRGITLDGGVGLILPDEAPVRYLPGGQIEYSRQAEWIAFMDTELIVSALSDDDRKFVTPGKRYTLADLWIDKMARR